MQQQKKDNTVGFEPRPPVVSGTGEHLYTTTDMLAMVSFNNLKHYASFFPFYATSRSSRPSN